MGSLLSGAKWFFSQERILNRKMYYKRPARKNKTEVLEHRRVWEQAHHLQNAALKDDVAEQGGLHEAEQSSVFPARMRFRRCYERQTAARTGPRRGSVRSHTGKQAESMSAARAM